MAKIVLLCAIAVALSVWCVPVRAEEAPHRATVTHGTEGEAEPNLFSGSFADSLWTVVAFVTLALVLTKVAWKPLLAALDARQNHIAQQIRSAEDSRQKAEHMLEDYKQQGQHTIRQAAEEAQRHHQQMVEQTREEVLALRRRAHEEIDSARAAAVEELWKQTGEIVLRVGTEVLGRTLSPQDNQRLIDEAVTQIRHDGGL
jgi:F-type H+-transporting ATPase subunit b